MHTQSNDWTRLTTIDLPTLNLRIAVNVRGRRHSLQIGKPLDDGGVDRYCSLPKVSDEIISSELREGITTAMSRIAEHEAACDEMKRVAVETRRAPKNGATGRTGDQAKRPAIGGLSKLAAADAAKIGKADEHRAKVQSKPKKRNDRSTIDQQIRASMRGASGGGGKKR